MASMVARIRSRISSSSVAFPAPKSLLSLAMASSSGSRRHAGVSCGSTRRILTPFPLFHQLRDTTIPSVDPSKFPDETFELWSIPAFDLGAPEICKGSTIGSQKKCVTPGDILLSKIVPHIRRAWVVKSNDHDCKQIASGEWITFRSGDVVPQ